MFLKYFHHESSISLLFATVSYFFCFCSQINNRIQLCLIEYSFSCCTYNVSTLSFCFLLSPSFLHFFSHTNLNKNNKNNKIRIKYICAFKLENSINKFHWRNGKVDEVDSFNFGFFLACILMCRLYNYMSLLVFSLNGYDASCISFMNVYFIFNVVCHSAETMIYIGCKSYVHSIMRLQSNSGP